MKRIKNFIPLIIILILMIIIYFFGGFYFLSFDTLQKYRSFLLHFLNEHPILSPLLFIITYIIVAALSIPGAVFVTLLGGFLFKQPFSTIYVLIGATIGACIIFIAAKTALRDYLEKKAAPFLQKFSKGFSKNAASYLLFLRLVPLFPFWFVNIAPAFFNIRFRTFVWTTFIGILPGSFVFAQAGAGLGSILDQKKEFSINSIFTLEIKIALIALGIFALVPIVIKKLRKNAR